MSDKLTPRQNELISEALCIAVRYDQGTGLMTTPEKLKELRRALVSELEAVTAETDLLPSSSVRSICG